MSRLEVVVQNMLDNTTNTAPSNASRLELLLIQLGNKYDMEIGDVETLVNEINGEGV